MKNNNENRSIIAIDGVAASGKSTAAKSLAKSLGLRYLDTGAIYRAAALSVLRGKVNPDNEEAVIETITTADIRVNCSEDKMEIYLNDVEISEEIRTPEVAALTSRISALSEVREAMVKLQREAVNDGGFVVEGRDIGTVVFPDAGIKFFLTATAAERAKRRFAELNVRHDGSSIEEIERDIADRDLRDSTRSESPLRKADDAIEVDTTEMTIDEQVKHLTRIIEAEMHKESKVYVG